MCIGLSTKPLSDLGHSKRSFMISLKLHLERKNVKYAPHGEQYTVSLHEWISHNILTQMWNEALNVGAPCVLIVLMLFCLDRYISIFIIKKISFSLIFEVVGVRKIYFLPPKNAEYCHVACLIYKYLAERLNFLYWIIFCT